ncbi:MAG: hypothetical protein ACI9MC_001689, partial [Kiritimatiellia bacterium]
MQTVRSLVVVLGLLGMGAASAWNVEVAYAQSGPTVFQGAGLIEIVPAGDVIGDGVTPVRIQVIALAPDGTPLTGLRLKPAASAGSVAGWTEGAGGVYSFVYTAPNVSSQTDIELSIKGKTATRAVVNSRYTISVRPPMSTGIKIVSNPPQLVLGQELEGSISLTIEGVAGDLTADDLLVSVSAGELVNLTHLGNGRFTGRYVAPKVNFPQLAVVSVMDARAPDRVYGALAIPLLGKTDYPVQAQPGASVVLRIGGREFGPAKAGPTGRVAVAVVVPPGVSTATKIEVINGQTNTSEIDLRVPETSRVAFLPMRKALPGDGLTAVPVRVAVYGTDGAPQLNAPVVFRAKGGTVSPGKHVGNGIYEAMFTPRAANDTVTAEVSASIQGAPIQKDSAELRIVAGRPQKLTLRAQPEKLLKGATSLRLFAKITGASGQGLDRRDLALSVSGASVKGDIQDLRNGDYRVDMSADGKTHVNIVAAVQSAATGSPLFHILLLPHRDVVPADGASATRVTVIGVDEFGYPIPNLDIDLAVESGDGSVPPTVRTDDNGMGLIYYTSGSGSGLVRLRVSSGNRTGAVSMVQATKSITATVPTSGTEGTIALVESWKNLVLDVKVPREGASDAVTGPVDLAGTEHAGDISVVTVVPSPSSAAAGGRVTLSIDAKDAKGLGVAGVSFDVMVSQGQSGAVSDLGGGKYSAVVTLPVDAVGELKVSIAYSDRAAFLKVPVTGSVAGSGQAWGDQVATGEVVETTPNVVSPEEPKESSDRDWTSNRLQAAYTFGAYTYQQSPNVEGSGPLLPAVIAVGGENGGDMATPQGMELNYEGWFH